jgi:hypothetical protein
MTLSTSCQACSFFQGSPVALERAAPLLRALSSAHGSSRSDDGVCLRHDRFVPAFAFCSVFVPVTAAARHTNP